MQDRSYMRQSETSFLLVVKTADSGNEPMTNENDRNLSIVSRRTVLNLRATAACTAELMTGDD